MIQFIGKIEDDTKLMLEKQIVICGWGKTGQIVFNFLQSRGLNNNIVAVCDNNRKLTDTTYQDMVVSDVKDIVKKFPCATYVIASCCVLQIVQQLHVYGIKKIHITRG